MNGAGFVLSPLFGGTLYAYAKDHYGASGLQASFWLAIAILIGMATFAMISRRIRSTVGVFSPSGGGQEPN